MSLSTYLQNNKITYDDFAELIGSTATSVYRYAKGLRTPKPSMMNVICKVTNGQVTANDFYDLPKNQSKKKR